MKGIIQRAHVIFGGTSLCRECVGHIDSKWREESKKYIVDPDKVFFEITSEGGAEYRTNKALDEALS